MRFFAFFLIAFLFITACTPENPTKKVTLTAPNKTQTYAFNVEVADTSRKRNQGLMHRKNLPKNGGMLFTWPKEESRMRGFWMKNTPLPLTLIYALNQKVVYVIRRAEPYSEKNLLPPQKVDAVLEIDANHSAASYVQAGWNIAY